MIGLTYTLKRDGAPDTVVHALIGTDTGWDSLAPLNTEDMMNVAMALMIYAEENSEAYMLQSKVFFKHPAKSARSYMYRLLVEMLAVGRGMWFAVEELKDEDYDQWYTEDHALAQAFSYCKPEHVNELFTLKDSDFESSEEGGDIVLYIDMTQDKEGIRFEIDARQFFDYAFKDLEDYISTVGYENKDFKVVMASTSLGEPYTITRSSQLDGLHYNVFGSNDADGLVILFGSGTKETGDEKVFQIID